MFDRIRIIRYTYKRLGTYAMKTTVIDNIPYWIDENDNKWNAIRTSEGDAEHFSETLVNCTKCTDCQYCINCISCEACENCIDCNSCYGCYRCIFCHYCEECEGCFYCQICEDCTECHQCLYCYDCRKCFSCEYCGTCKLKNSCKYMRYEQKMDDVKEEDINTGGNTAVEVEDTLEEQDEAGKNV